MENKIAILNYEYLNKNVIPRIAVEWYDIGIELNIPRYRLDNIKTGNQHHHHIHQCLQMLQMWLQRSSSVEKSRRPTWENMYNAMVAVELTKAAETLKKEIANIS